MLCCINLPKTELKGTTSVVKITVVNGFHEAELREKVETGAHLIDRLGWRADERALKPQPLKKALGGCQRQRTNSMGNSLRSRGLH